MRGISKDIPWPGSRCGWIEFHNTKRNAAFAAYAEGVKKHMLPIENADVRTFIEQEVQKPGIAPDKRFAYYLLANTGIVVTPASDFFSPHFGFRVTTLDRDPEKLKLTYGKLKAAIQAYLAS